MTPRRRRSTVNGYGYQWSLFVDWCAAADVEALPASPFTLAEFLDENPAGDAVQLRRVSAINRAHLDAGHPAPGRVTSIRMALDSARSERTIRRAEQYQVIVAGLPISGSTAALLGRRDAVLLVPAVGGLVPQRYCWTGPHRHHHRRRQGVDRRPPPSRHRPPQRRHRFRARHDMGRWHTVLQFSDRYPSTTLLEENMQRNTFPDMAGSPQRRGPVAVPIDRWGATCPCRSRR